MQNTVGGWRSASFRRASFGVGLFLFAALTACAGHVEHRGGTDTGSLGSAGSGGSGSGSNDLPQHALGVCSPGFSQSAFPNRSCNWLSDKGICFDTEDQACNCICPTQGASVCSNAGYGGPGTASPIYCDKI